MNAILYLMPAYGAHYDDQDDVIAAWRKGTDFKIVKGPYCSSRDIDMMRADGFTTLRFFYRPHTYFDMPI